MRHVPFFFLLVLSGCAANAPTTPQAAAALQPSAAPPSPPAAGPAKDDPFPLASAKNAWFVLDWSMSLDDAHFALESAGLAIQGDRATGALFAERDGWKVMVARQGAMSITVVHDDATPAVVSAAETRAAARFGSSSWTTRSVETSWGAAGGGGLKVDAVVGRKGDLGEEWIRGSGTGPVGTLGFDWRMSFAGAKAALEKAGYKVAKPSANPQDKEDDALTATITGGPSVDFSRGSRTGTARFVKGALTRVTIHEPGDLAAGAARVTELSKLYGEPSSVRKSRTTSWDSPPTAAEIVVDETTPGPKHRIKESYYPTGP